MFKRKNENEHFKIFIDDADEKEFGVLLSKQPFINEKEISELFSHLVHVDEAQMEKNIFDSKFGDRFIKMRLNYSDPSNPNKNQEEVLKIPLGHGHFSKGLNHLRIIGKENLDEQVNKSEKFFKNLSEKYDKFLRKPTEIGIDVLQKSGWYTMEVCSKIFGCVPSEELQQLLKGFSRALNEDKENDKKDFSKRIQEFLTKNQKEKSQKFAEQLDKSEGKNPQKEKGQELSDQKEELRQEVNAIVKKNLSKPAKDKELQRKPELSMTR